MKNLFNDEINVNETCTSILKSTIKRIKKAETIVWCLPSKFGTQQDRNFSVHSNFQRIHPLSPFCPIPRIFVTILI